MTNGEFKSLLESLLTKGVEKKRLAQFLGIGVPTLRNYCKGLASQKAIDRFGYLLQSLDEQPAFEVIASKNPLVRRWAEYKELSERFVEEGFTGEDSIAIGERGIRQSILDEAVEWVKRSEDEILREIVMLDFQAKRDISWRFRRWKKHNMTVPNYKDLPIYLAGTQKKFPPSKKGKKKDGRISANLRGFTEEESRGLPSLTLVKSGKDASRKLGYSAKTQAGRRSALGR